MIRINYLQELRNLVKKEEERLQDQLKKVMCSIYQGVEISISHLLQFNYDKKFITIRLPRGFGKTTSLHKLLSDVIFVSPERRGGSISVSQFKEGYVCAPIIMIDEAQTIFETIPFYQFPNSKFILVGTGGKEGNLLQNVEFAINQEIISGETCKRTIENFNIPYDLIQEKKGRYNDEDFRREFMCEDI